MGIKETPTNIKVYYKSMINAVTQKKEQAVEAYENLVSLEESEYKEIKHCKDIYKNHFNVDLDKYPEFINNTYNEGRFFKVAKGMFINRSNNYELVADLFTLYNLAKHQKDIYDIKKQIDLYDKMLNLTLKRYTEILKIYMTEVHKKMVLEGAGYMFGESIGWICINRCVLKRPRPHIDYAATKKREAQLKAEGKRIYNKDEAEWCKRNGLEYKAEDKRVFRTNEYCYEIPLINCKLPNGTKLKLEIADYRHSSVRGKTNDDLIKECQSNTTRICELPVDLRTKLTLCDTTDKILYTTFIRNEAQQPINTPKANRKN